MPAGQEQRQHGVGHEQHGDQRHAAHELDEDHREHADDRQPRAPPERQQDPERQREHDADRRDHEGDEDAAPERGRRPCSSPSQLDAGEEDEGEDRERRRRNRSRPSARLGASSHSSQPTPTASSSEEDVDAPAHGDRIGAVDEVVDLVDDEGPAGPDRTADDLGPAGVAVRARSRPRRRTGT